MRALPAGYRFRSASGCTYGRCGGESAGDPTQPYVRAAFRTCEFRPRGLIVSSDGSAGDLGPPVVRVRDRVWWSDVDKMGIMYFGRYVRFAEMAETEFFRAVGYAYDDIHAQFAVWLARIHLDIDFRRPARLDEELVCRAELVKLGGSSIHFRFPVERAADGARLADIGLVLACLDAATLKTTRIPGVLRERLQPYLPRPT